MNQLNEHNKISLEELKELLRGYGIDFSKWGTGKTKKIEDLYKEIEKGETILDYDDEGNLLRRLKVVGANIFYTNSEGITYNLREIKQVFKDNRDNRFRELDFSVGEKMQSGECPLDAILRGIKEELGIMGILNINDLREEIQLLDSNSYPGLLTKQYRYLFKVILAEEQYNPDGYIEEQEDKTTYFEWEQLK